MTKSTSGGCDQFETSPEAIDQELRTAFCERRQIDRLKTNYRIDSRSIIIHVLEVVFPQFNILEGARASTGVSLPCVDVGYKHWSNDRPLCA